MVLEVGGGVEEAVIRGLDFSEEIAHGRVGLYIKHFV